MPESAKQPVQLTYCLNVHPGETWADNFNAIQTHAMAVRSLVARGAPFGLGLRLGAAAATELSEHAALEAFAGFLGRNNLHVFTVNGFPYGAFHGTRVKEDVYRPDWSTSERRDYTMRLADIMAILAPAGGSASISTSPCSFKAWAPDAAAMDRIVANLAETAVHLEVLSRARQVDLHVGLEPEPACLLETTDEVIAFLSHFFIRGSALVEALMRVSAAEAGKILRRRIGVCFDTCHVALQFEDLCDAWDRYVTAGIRISKVQISAALACPPTPASLKELRRFDEPVYLHQTHGRRADGSLVRWVDLPFAFRALDTAQDFEELRCHFHVPLFWTGDGCMGSTARLLTPSFFERLRSGLCTHLEVETYTFSVLPEELRRLPVHQSIAQELRWTRERLGPTA